MTTANFPRPFVRGNDVAESYASLSLTSKIIHIATSIQCVNGIDVIGMTISTQLVDRSLNRRAVVNDPSKSIAQEEEAGIVLRLPE